MKKKKFFGTDGIRGRVGQEPITPDCMLKLGWAAGRVLNKQGRNRVLIGKDTRISGYMFESALEAGFSAAGVDIRLLGPMPTPAVAYLTRTFRADLGIMITASHNDHFDNGVKFFSSQGYKLDDSLEEAIESMMEQPLRCVDSSQLGKADRVTDAAGRYIEFCKSTFASHLNLNGVRLVVDCAQGATYHIAPNVFRELGAEVIEVSVDPDGLNINDNCGSLKPAILQRLVKAEGVDAGIAFDGDGDRLIMVDHTGEVVDGDDCLYAIARYKQQQGTLDGGVVGTAMSNLGLEKALNKLGITFDRSAVGDRYVMELLQKRRWVVGGEQSGHLICLDQTTTGDGIVSSLQVLSAMVHSGKTLKELCAPVVKFPQKLSNIRLNKGCDYTQNTQVMQAIEAAETQLKGVGRVLIRPSGTEPVLRVMVEAQEQALVDSLSSSLTELMAEELA